MSTEPHLDNLFDEKKKLNPNETPPGMSPLFWETLRSGESTKCPCCARTAKIYKRQINAGIARQLIRLYHTGGLTNYVHNARLIMPGQSGVSDFGTARFWSLIEAKPHEPGEKKASGYWMLTVTGAAFVRRNIKLQQYALIYDNQFYGFDGPELSIGDCLGNEFNYEELMAQRGEV